MEIQKIISGAQTGADRAALDFALEYGIECGGWVPPGRQAEDGPVAKQYHVWEMESGGYPERTEKNVEDSDGTLIFSHGELTGGSLLTREYAEKHGKPCLHIDFNRLIAFDAAIDVNDWLSEYRIAVLNVAGPRESKNPRIYQAVFKMLETVFYISIISGVMPDASGRAYDAPRGEDNSAVYPASVADALDTLAVDISAKTKAQIASMPDDTLSEAGISLGRWLRRQFGLSAGNLKLLKACRDVSGKPNLDADGAAMLIVREFRKRLRKLGHLRVIK